MSNPSVASDIEVIKVEQSTDLNLLAGGHIDGPRRGSVTGSVFRMAGWVVGRATQAVAVQICCGDTVLRAARVEIDRPDVAAVYPGSAGAGRSGFRVQLDGTLLPPMSDLRVVALLEDGSSAAVGCVQVRHGAPVSPAPESVELPGAPSLKPTLKDLLSRAVSQISLTDEHASLLDRLPLAGQRVLDLGSGIGDLSRTVRTRGAALVDGYEVDESQVQLARILNVYHDSTRVSFYERDITKPDSYEEQYDVVLALSQAHNLGGVMPNIAAITNLLFAIELVGPENAEASLVSVIEAAFASSKIVPSESAGRRYLVAFTNAMKCQA